MYDSIITLLWVVICMSLLHICGKYAYNKWFVMLFAFFKREQPVELVDNCGRIWHGFMFKDADGNLYAKRDWFFNNNSLWLLNDDGTFEWHGMQGWWIPLRKDARVLHMLSMDMSDVIQIKSNVNR